MEPAELRSSRRRFRLADGLILIGALAFGLNSLRGTAWLERFNERSQFWSEAFSELTGHIPQPLLVKYPREDLEKLVISQVLDEVLQQALGAIVWALTIAQPVLRLRSPRPPLGHVVREAGFVTCVTALIGYFVTLDLQVIGGLVLPPWSFVGLALILLWPALGLYPWRRQPNWIDRLGRAVGWGWIVVEAGGAMAAYLLGT
jgi:hypothetical protein